MHYTAAMELLAPAGSLSAAVYAYVHGADAVYFGFPFFSARSAAKNLTFPQLRRLKAYAAAHGKRMYAAVNTIIRQDEYSRLIEIAEQCAYLGVDGIIIQDFGVLTLLRSHVPDIPIHASTQMAVHNIYGAEVLAEQGFSRVILSRELTLDEIGKIISSVPSLAYEVFVHGALCYSVSGLCLASGILLGRSANRGACAQICRTWFELDSGRKRGYFFSMKDLDLGAYISSLKELGVAACKIEGRMKSPEYAGTVSSFYRHILDHGEPPADNSELHKVAFSRETSTGWIGGCHDQQLTSPDYPAHRGVFAGTAASAENCWAKVALRVPVALRDGLQYFTRDHLPQPRAFSIARMRDSRRKPLTQASRNQTVEILLPEKVRPGTELYKISDHALRWPHIKEASLPIYRRAIDTEIRLDTNLLEFSASFPWNPEEVHSRSYHVHLDQARTSSSFEDTLRLKLSSSGASLFTLGNLNITSEPSLAGTDVFIPPSQLKEIRRNWYAWLDSRFPSFSLNCRHSNEHQAIDTMHTPPRSTLNPPGDKPFPFVVDPDKTDIYDIAQIVNTWFIPLNPVLFDAEAYARSLNSLAERMMKADPSARIVLGLNNPAHICIARQMISRYNADVWIDIYLYQASCYAADAFARMLPKPPLFGYYWLEDAAPPSPMHWGYPVHPVDESFHAPLCISRICFAKEVMPRSCSSCRDAYGQWKVRQHSRIYTVIQRSSMSYLFLLP